MNPEVWRKIQSAVQFILDGGANRVDGEGFTVYRAGTIVRIDIKDTSA